MKSISFVAWKENNEFVAQCLNVDVASQGETLDEAIKNLKEAVELYFQDEPNKTLPEVESIFLGKESIDA
jgi:predicted RNase H-like HicB family nuclease